MYLSVVFCFHCELYNVDKKKTIAGLLHPMQQNMTETSKCKIFHWSESSDVWVHNLGYQIECIFLKDIITSFIGSSTIFKILSLLYFPFFLKLKIKLTMCSLCYNKCFIKLQRNICNTYKAYNA